METHSPCSLSSRLSFRRFRHALNRAIIYFLVGGFGAGFGAGAGALFTVPALPGLETEPLVFFGIVRVVVGFLEVVPL